MYFLLLQDTLGFARYAVLRSRICHLPRKRKKIISKILRRKSPLALSRALSYLRFFTFKLFDHEYVSKWWS